MTSSAVEIAFLHAAERLIDPRRELLVAVSGGGDSVALARLVASLAPARRPPARLIHLDHGLRDGAGDDRRAVESLAAALELPCIAERREVARDDGESLEDAARRVRRAFLVEHAQRLDATVALGHTLDDQAETILMRWARGAGPTAMAGIAERGPGPFVRPLLDIERDALRDWLRAGGHGWIEDPHNADPRFERTRARGLLATLREQLNPQVARHVAASAARLRVDAAYLDELAAARSPALVSGAGPTLRIDAAGLAGEPTALAGRVAALALRRAGVDPRRVLSVHVEALIDLARGGRGRSIDLPDGVRAERLDDAVLLTPAGLVD